MSPVQLEIESGVASIVLDSPATGNFVDSELARSVVSACESIGGDESVRAIVIASSGDDFCQGGAGLGSSDWQRVAQPVSQIRVPVLAALCGGVFDQGLELALAADIRIAAPGTRFAMRQVIDGGFPFDGGTQRLPRIAGPSVAVDMLLTGRELNASEALGYGLVSEVVEDPVGRAREVATAIAGRGRLASEYTKEAVLAALNVPFEQGARLEADLSFLLHGTEERAEGLAAFRERRAMRMPGAPDTS